MNFLSHFYFVRSNPNPYYTLGSILPDLFRNHRNDWKFGLDKQHINFDDDKNLAALFAGWKSHLQVDKLFHNSTIFKLQTSQLRIELEKVFSELPKRPFFLAHVGYELILDSLLIRNKLIDTNLFYRNLSESNSPVLDHFMIKIGINQTKDFHAFLEHFINVRYLESYSNPKSLVHALDNIGRRVWVEKFSNSEINNSIQVLEKTLNSLNPHFIDVFNELEKEIIEKSI